MRLCRLIITILFFGTPNARACIWQDGDQPFWPSNKIEVCFLSQEEHLTSDLSLVKAYNDARSTIQRVVHQQINLRNTGFELFGFKTCDDGRRTPSDKDDLPHKIRINLGSNLKQSRVEMTNGLIGPANGKKSVNVHLEYISQRINKKDKTRYWANLVNSPAFEGTTLHEILHMFGIHHEHSWNSPSLGTNTKNKYVKLGDSMDTESIVCVDPALCDGRNNGAVLSNGDIRCLQEISSRRIKSFSTPDNKVNSGAQIVM